MLVSSALSRSLLASSLAALCAFAACGGTTSNGGGGSDGGSGDDDGGASTFDGGTTSDDGGSSSGSDAGGSGTDAGSAPRNAACTPLSKQKGTAVSTDYGRLDGTLVYVLGQNGSPSCNGDDTHIHLQVQVASDVYDVAVDIGKTDDEVGLEQKAIDVPGGVWSEGWHPTDALGYETLGLHSTDLPLAKPSSVASQLEGLLAATTHVSIFCTGYTDHTGCHDVHYQNGTSEDGAIVLDPSTANAPVVFLRFSGDSF